MFRRRIGNETTTLNRIKQVRTYRRLGNKYKNIYANVRTGNQVNINMGIIKGVTPRRTELLIRHINELLKYINRTNKNANLARILNGLKTEILEKHYGNINSKLIPQILKKLNNNRVRINM